MDRGMSREQRLRQAPGHGPAARSRAARLQRLDGGHFDVGVVGAGINGAAAAAAIAARGLSVALVDQGDFAGATSSSSSNLIWGGVKYLESGELSLVFKLCGSRNALARAYPDGVRETRFLANVGRGARVPGPVMWLGTWLYWFLGRCSTEPPTYLARARLKEREPAFDTSDTQCGFEYSDYRLVDGDARFVFGFVKRFVELGGVAANYVEVVATERAADHWRLDATDQRSGRPLRFSASCLVNACGPWADAANQRAAVRTAVHHVLSKGVHLIVPRVSASERILTSFASDGRMFFVIPFGPRSSIGTTDTRTRDPREGVLEEDRRFILDNANALLDLPRPLTRADVLAERCGVRPLAVEGTDSGLDWMQLSRKHVLETDPARRHVSIFGGKLTACLNVGREVADAVAAMGLRGDRRDARWFGEPAPGEKAAFSAFAQNEKLDALTAPGASEPLSRRLWRRYGLAARSIAGHLLAAPADAEVVFPGAELSRAELAYIASQEMVETIEDVVRRRTELAGILGPARLRDPVVLRRLAALLFGEERDARLREFLSSP